VVKEKLFVWQETRGLEQIINYLVGRLKDPTRYKLGKILKENYEFSLMTERR